MEPPWKRLAKVCSNGPGHMTGMATMYGKKLKNLLLPNQNVNELETYVTLGAQILPSLFKLYLALTLTYFITKSNLVPYAFL